ncbi:hypothetical protein CRUP_026367, partial [Coryphaenoides rupestris]
MEISWEPLSNLERNGPNLRYSVWWRRQGAGEGWSNVTTAGAKHTVHDTDTYVPYDIKVQARNDFGHGPESNVVTGYSGEDKPVDPPIDLRVSKVDSTSANIHWTPVDPTSILGEFKDCTTGAEASLLKVLRVSQEQRTKGFYSTAQRPSGVLGDLVPYSLYRMHLVVANHAYEGPPSNTVEFRTKEGA